MCFSRRDHAERFVESYCLENAIIIGVKALGIGYPVNIVIANCASHPWNLEFRERSKRFSHFIAAPVGTIAFEAVKVLE